MNYFLMRKYVINILIISVGMLVVALIAVQIAWLINAQQTKADAEKLKVSETISAATRQIEKTNGCVQFFTKYHLQPGEGFYISKQQWGGNGFKNDVDTVSMYYDYTEFRGTAEQQQTIPYEFNNIIMSSMSADVEMLVRVHFFPDSNISLIRRYDHLSRANYREVISEGLPLSDMISFKITDSIIKEHFLNAGIDTNYTFGFLLGDSIAYASENADTVELINTENRTNIFSENRFVPTYTLAVVFPVKPVWYSVNSLMIISVVIIVLLTYAFYKFVRVYYKQKKLSEMKTDFINNLTHEFNTPMANISLAIETISDNDVVTDKKLNGILDIISAESTRLRGNIDRALNVATIEKGKLSINNEEVNLQEIVTAIEPAYAQLCEHEGGSLSVSFSGRCIVLGDETHLLNAICNILDNAIKYRKGEPEISIDIKETDSHVQVSIKDNGKGMTAETMKHIFDKFYRAHEGDVHNTKGFGLGLSYVKGIIEAMKGKVKVFSKVGVGSTFIITLPKMKYHAK